MGSVLITNNPMRRHPNFEMANPDDDNNSIAGQKCFSVRKLKGRKKREYQEQCESPLPDQKITTMVQCLTLREWILSSPGRQPECFNGRESFVFSPLFEKVFPTSPEVDETSISMTAMPCKARDSFSLERPLKISGEDDRDEEQEEGAVSSASICRTESGRSTKKVRFKLPEEADIIIFYSPRYDY
ncbi:hypothetical protein BT93_D1963 [Corymbia citriodora subsp. variegata]|nr:hypothetical protein BT93_D1963 [Corymbia citriodora subsp. variegata]